MLKIPLPFPHTELLVTPRWAEFHWAAQVGMILLALLPLALVLWLYRYELQVVRKGTAITLLALRMVALGFLLFIALLQPVVARESSVETPSRVFVTLDRSASMDVTDPQRQPLEKLRLARNLRLAGDVCSDPQLDAWIKQYQEHGAPVWVSADEFPQDATRRRELEQERRQQHDKVCQRVDEITRTEMARRILTGDNGLLQAIAAKHQLDLTGFAQALWEVKADQPDDLFAAPPAPGSGTDLKPPLERVVERAAGEPGKILGVVVLTDGQHNHGPSPVPRAIELGKQKIPVYPIGLGTRQSPPLIAITEVKSLPTVFKDVDVDVQARVMISGLPAQEITVELERPGQPPMTQIIKHDGTDRPYVASFKVRLEQVGTQTLKVTAKQLPGAPGPESKKVRTENNNRQVVIRVVDDKAKVLLVDREAHWEYHYLASALARDKTVQLKKVVFQQPRLGKLPEEELVRLGNPSLKLPAGPDALADFDCIILGDVTPAQLPLAERTRLEKYVAERGGTLVMVAGKQALPMAYAAAPPVGNEDVDPLVRLLPITNPRPFNSNDGFRVRLTDEGQRTQFLEMEPTVEKSKERWSLLPPHYWAIIGDCKPGAVPLASFAEEKATRPVVGLKTEPIIADKAATTEDPARKRALIVRQNYGFGRVLYVGMDSTWRWRYKVGDTYHHRFWGQVVRWAASDKPLIAGNDHIRFGTREPVYPQGGEVDVVVRLGEDVQPLGANALAGARIVRADEKNPSEEAVALVPLKALDAQPRLLEGRIRDLPPGRYFIELAIPDLADKLAGLSIAEMKDKVPSFTVTPQTSAENLELATNWPLLHELAQRSGGEVYTAENARELGDKLATQVKTLTVPTERKLWQEWATLVVFLGFLTVEWVGRKWAGLP
jgi:hypothetical protein